MAVLDVGNDGAITEFTKANVTTDSFSPKEKLEGQIGNNGTKEY